MDAPSSLPAEFFNHPVVEVARSLLGMRLVRRLDSALITGVITETEAYRGEEDLACHARHGLTPRTRIMYGPPGRAYIYFTYGMHWCLNVVCESEGRPCAVLLRAIQPRDGLPVIASRRPGRPAAAWCNGPAKLCQALAIDGCLNDIDLCDPSSPLFLAVGQPVPAERITASARIGIPRVPEPWRSQPWRFTLAATDFHPCPPTGAPALAGLQTG